MSVGALGYVGVGVESSAGTASGSVAIADYIPILSENLIVNRSDLDDNSILAQWDEVRVYNGQQFVSGDVDMQVHPLASGYFLRSVFDVTTAAKGNNSAALPASHSAVFLHRFTTKQTQFQSGSGSDLPTLTFEIYRGPAIGQGSSFAYYNCAGNTLELSVSAGQ